MSDFGEPWTTEVDAAGDRNGRAGPAIVIYEQWVRAVACVNALAGIADPAAQVAKWKAMDKMEARDAA